MFPLVQNNVRTVTRPLDLHYPCVLERPSMWVLLCLPEIKKGISFFTQVWEEGWVGMWGQGFGGSHVKSKSTREL